MITSRFSKLLDMIGGKIFPRLLEFLSLEFSESKPMRDILDQLEKLRVLESAAWWIDMREIRNHIAHEYPDNPKLMCQNMNAANNSSNPTCDILDLFKGRYRGVEEVDLTRAVSS